MTSPALIDTDGRSVPEWIGATNDTPIPDRVRVRVFLRFDGICQECKVKITTKRWVCDHRIAITNGGENRERNLGPIHETCDRTIKTPRDVKLKAKTYRIRKRHLGIRKSSSRPMPGSRASGLRKRIDGTVVRRT